MPVTVEFRKSRIEFATPITARGVLDKLNLPGESFHILRNGLIVDEEEELHDGDTVKLIPVITGG